MKLNILNVNETVNKASLMNFLQSQTNIFDKRSSTLPIQIYIFSQTFSKTKSFTPLQDQNKLFIFHITNTLNDGCQIWMFNFCQFVYFFTVWCNLTQFSWWINNQMDLSVVNQSRGLIRKILNFSVRVGGSNVSLQVKWIPWYCLLHIMNDYNWWSLEKMMLKFHLFLMMDVWHWCCTDVN